VLFVRENEGMTAWDWAANTGNLDILQKIWEWDQETLTKEEINNKVLLATDNEGMAAWHWAANTGKLDILQKIWECAQETLAK
jgi:ankyrin repeat protein